MFEPGTLKRFAFAAMLAGSVSLVGCQSNDKSEMAHAHGKMFEDVNSAVAVLHPTEGNDARGVVRFTQHSNGVRVQARFAGLEPNSTHGMHIHQYGDCTAADGTSAGGHYNPTDKPHGLPPAEDRHAGDLGNVTANDNGVATANLTVRNVTVAGMKNCILGRGMILHGQEDDGGQPTGNAGARLACGVIGVAQTAE